MSTPRDIHTSARPALHHHRQSLGTTPTSLPQRQSSYNNTHRVNRRKSTASSAGFNVNALAAALRDSGALQHGQIPVSKSSAQDANVEDAMDIDSSTHKSKSTAPEHGRASDTTVLVDGPPLSTMDRPNNRHRQRRDTDDLKPTKLERSRSIAAGELRCDKCGKGYKHGSCLTKHLWEHTPEWALTSKLLISKHQQVQLLEAASVLVAMNQNAPQPADAADLLPRHDRETSSESPVASGSSDPNEADDRSSRTSTPSQDESDRKLGRYGQHLRADAHAPAVSRSHPSTFASSAPNDASTLRYFPQWTSRDRAISSDARSQPLAKTTSTDLAAAAEGLLSCSLGTPAVPAAQLAPDVPPVPTLPVKYASKPRTRSFRSHARSDVRMALDEDDEGVFGQME